MDKKQNFKNIQETKATNAVENKTEALKKPRFIVRTWNRLISFNKLVFFNIMLLGLVISLLSLMYFDVNKMANTTASVTQNNPTIVVARNAHISLPIRRPRITSWQTRGDITIDGKKGNSKLPSMLTVNGNLYLQNLYTYTLPCNTNIRGNLLLRNVRFLKFCGRFNINGDIFVSSNSSFGPLPKNSRLGGTVVF